MDELMMLALLAKGGITGIASVNPPVVSNLIKCLSNIMDGGIACSLLEYPTRVYICTRVQTYEGTLTNL